MLFVSEIFEVRPLQWGLRGDPFLWNELRRSFADKELPCPKDQFAADFHALFQTLTGDTLGSKEHTFVQRYGDAGTGMSRGAVSRKFWSEKGLPLLLSRLDLLNEEYSA